MRQRVCVAVAAMLCSTAYADGPVEKYRATTRLHVYMCQLKLKTAWAVGATTLEGMKANPDTNWPGCLEDGQKELRVDFAAALRAVRKPAAIAALKEYQVAALSALAGVAPAGDEMRMHYRQRQATLQGKMTEAWARFEVAR